MTISISDAIPILSSKNVSATEIISLNNLVIAKTLKNLPTLEVKL